MNITRRPSEVAVKELIARALLPTADITPNHMENFFGAWSGSTLEGVVGVELYGTVALLRSLAVAVPRRGTGLGTRLLSRAEQYAREKGTHSVFLLTTTAEAYFGRRGYSPIARDAVPEAIQNTREFGSLCPSSAVLMVKHIEPTQR